MKKSFSIKINRRTTLVLALGGMNWRRAGGFAGKISGSRRLALYWAGRLALVVARAW